MPLRPTTAVESTAVHYLWASWGLVAVAAALTVFVLVKSNHRETPQRPVVAAAKPVVISAPVVQASVPAPAPVAVPASTVVLAEAAAPRMAAAPASAPSPTKAADKDSAPATASASASRRWLLGLPPASWVVVHAQKASLRDADAFRSGQSLLANARILQTSGPQGQYLVVTGPFRSPERAKNYIQRLDWKASARGVGRDELLTQVPR